MEFGKILTKNSSTVISSAEKYNFNMPIVRAGRGIDMSKAKFDDPFDGRIKHGLLTEIMNSPYASEFIEVRRGRDGRNEMILKNFYWNEEKQKYSALQSVEITYELGEQDPAVCCYTKGDVNQALFGGDVSLNYLCYKNCYSNPVDRFFEQHLGRSQYDANVPYTNERALGLKEFAFWEVLNIYYGNGEEQGGYLKKFDGLAKYFNNTERVVPQAGFAILAEIDNIACYAEQQGGFWVAGAHPEVFANIYKTVNGYEFQNVSIPDSFTYRGIKFVQDSYVPYDKDTQLGEMWVLDRNSMALIMEKAINQTLSDYYVEKAFNDDPAQGCLTECEFLDNIGGVILKDFRKILRYVNIAGGGACGTLPQFSSVDLLDSILN